MPEIKKTTHLHTPPWPHPSHTAAFQALGVMSGTSADGADAVLLGFDRLDRPHVPRVLGYHHVPYPDALQKELCEPEQLHVGRIAELHALLPEYYAKAVKGIEGYERAVCCGMHGQTLWHKPPPHPTPTTLQIGSSARMAQLIGLPVVGDMRMADVHFGGQGAPLVPLAHWFFAAPKSGANWVVNFGGICNVSHVTQSAEGVMGFDVGPGMMLSNAFAASHTQGKKLFDEDGHLSRGGELIPALYEAILAHPFLALKPPKSTGREDFGLSFCRDLLAQHAPGHPPQNVAYSLLAATAEALVRAQTLLPQDAERPREVILTGGGARNPTLVALIQERFVKADVKVAPENHALSSQMHEAAAMALIGARTFYGLKSGLCAVTGAKHSALLGHVHMPTDMQ